MGDRKRHHRYQLTINNPGEEWTHEKVKFLLGTMKLKYWCMGDEIGLEQQTPHTHIYFVADTSAIDFTVVKDRFPTAHIEVAKGNSPQNRAYVQKSGKWEDDPKSDTVVPGTFEEWGELPIERPGARTDLDILYQHIKDGLSNYEIMEINPDYMLNLDKIERARQAVMENATSDLFRELEVYYVWGPTGVGKTRGVMETYGYKNVYRVTDYAHPFDSYAGQDVLLLDEYTSNFKIQDLLVYTDGYPVSLPARYANRVACYTKVFIVSNLCLSKQYQDIQFKTPETFVPLLRRINKVVQFIGPGEYQVFDTAEYMDCPFLAD